MLHLELVYARGPSRAFRLRQTLGRPAVYPQRSMSSRESPEHKDFVEKCAKRLSKELRLHSVELGDLIGYGWDGLLQAQKRFDPTHPKKRSKSDMRTRMWLENSWLRGRARSATRSGATPRRADPSDRSQERSPVQDPSTVRS